MTEEQLRSLLEDVRTGVSDVDSAVGRMKHLPFEDLGFAKIDHHRALRHGMPELVCGLGKPADHVVAITQKPLDRGGNVLFTPTTPPMAAQVMNELPGGEY